MGPQTYLIQGRNSLVYDVEKIRGVAEEICRNTDGRDDSPVLKDRMDALLHTDPFSRKILLSLVRETIFKEDSQVLQRPVFYFDPISVRTSLEVMSTVLTTMSTLGSDAGVNFGMFLSVSEKGRGKLIKKGIENTAMSIGSSVECFFPGSSASVELLTEDKVRSLSGISYMICCLPAGGGGIQTGGAGVCADSVLRLAHRSFVTFINPESLPSMMPDLTLKAGRRPGVEGVSFEVMCFRQGALRKIDTVTMGTGTDDAGGRLGSLLDAAKRDPYCVKISLLDKDNSNDDLIMLAPSRKGVRHLLPWAGISRIVPAGDLHIVVISRE